MGRKATTKQTSPPDGSEAVRPASPAAALDERLLNTRELMEFMNLSRSKVWDLVNNHGLPAYRVGGDYRYLRSEVLAWLQQYRVNATEEGTEKSQK